MLSKALFQGWTLNQLHNFKYWWSFLTFGTKPCFCIFFSAAYRTGITWKGWIVNSEAVINKLINSNYFLIYQLHWMSSVNPENRVWYHENLQYFLTLSCSAHISCMFVDLKHFGRSQSLPIMPLWPCCFPALGQAVSPAHISGVRRAELRGHGWTIYCLHVSPSLPPSNDRQGKPLNYLTVFCISACVEEARSDLKYLHFNLWVLLKIEFSWWNTWQKCLSLGFGCKASWHVSRVRLNEVSSSQ